jgi:uroporphyrinogen-III synthase
MVTIRGVDLEPLRGFVVGVTADRRAEEQIQLLTRKGATVLHGPTIRTHPLGREADVAAATQAIIERPPDVTLLSTGIGIRGWFEAAESLDLADDLLDALAGSVVFARGKKAHGAAVTAGLAPEWHGPIGTTAEMVDELRGRGAEGRRVAVQLDGDEGRSLATAVRELGADVIPVPIYRWTMPDDTAAARRLVTGVAERRLDAVTFTARPQVENLCALAEEAGLLDEVVAGFNDTVLPVCVGPVCARAALDAGFGEPLVPDRHRLGSMVLLVARSFEARARDFELGGVPVRVQGRAAVVASDLVQLTDRECDVLHALAARFGAVLSKQQLLDQVWHGRESDEHVVEVTVARLRQRLGAAGMGVETVVRRGYRLSAA